METIQFGDKIVRACSLIKGAHRKECTSIVPFSEGNYIVEFFSILKIIEDFKAAGARIKVYNPFLSKQEIKTGTFVFSNVISYPSSFKKIGSIFSFPQRRLDKMQAILKLITEGNPCEHFCIIPIRLTNNSGIFPSPSGSPQILELHSNTLIIWKQNDMVFSYIVEPHGFLKYPFPIERYTNANYFTDISEWLETLANIQVVLINKYVYDKIDVYDKINVSDEEPNQKRRRIVTDPVTEPVSNVVDTYLNDLLQVELDTLSEGCQASQQNNMKLLVETGSDKLVISDRMCTTLSAFLTKKIIQKIFDTKDSKVFDCDIITCDNIRVADIIRLNIDILEQAAFFLLQIQSLHLGAQTRSNKVNLDKERETVLKTFSNIVMPIDISSSEQDILGQKEMRFQSHEDAKDIFRNQTFLDSPYDFTIEGLIFDANINAQIERSRPPPSMGGSYRKTRKRIKKKKSHKKKKSQKKKKSLKKKKSQKKKKSLKTKKKSLKKKKL